jgi:hypothetical protein
MTEDDQVIQPRGIVVLPIMPGRDNWDLDVSVMTLSNVLYTPTAKTSEVSWPVLESQGFTLHRLKRHHEIAREIPARLWAQMRDCKIIRHPNLPGVDVLWCLRKPRDGKLYLGVIADGMVDMKAWKEGIEDGVLGKAVDMPGTLGWTQACEHSEFEKIVLGDTHRGTGGLRDASFVVA